MNTLVHGGPDSQGVAWWDFSTNANACGPAPTVLAAVRSADVSRYPDPAARALREALADFHGTSAARVLPGASASEIIRRMTQAIALSQPQGVVHAPLAGFGEYAHAAQALGLTLGEAAVADLVWHTEPASPRGVSSAAPAIRDGATLVIDCAYAPLRLEGDARCIDPWAWQLWSPNKALGLTGVRGAYAIAPAGAQALAARLESLAPSWPLGAEGTAMLSAWPQPDTQAWLQRSRLQLADWKQRQLDLMDDINWPCERSVVPFYVAQWTDPQLRPEALRAHGIKLRDTGSMGLAGHVRLSVQPPAAQAALREAWRSLKAGR